MTQAIGGYAPGNYSCVCYFCQAEFEGDKRAIHCLTCAATALQNEVAHLREQNRDLVQQLNGAGSTKSIPGTELRPKGWASRIKHTMLYQIYPTREFAVFSTKDQCEGPVFPVFTLEQVDQVAKKAWTDGVKSLNTGTVYSDCDLKSQINNLK